MFHYITDEEYLKKLKYTCSDIINQLVQYINNDSVLQVEAHLVGSGAKNLITQNANEPVDLDYNLYITEFHELRQNDGRGISTYIQDQFDYILNKNDWSDCHDSTSVFTTEKRQFNIGNKTPFSIDLAVVKKDSYGWHRLIHQKTGVVAFDQFYWNLVPDSRDLLDRASAIKKEHLWNDVIDSCLRVLHPRQLLRERRENLSHPKRQAAKRAGRPFRSELSGQTHRLQADGHLGLSHPGR